MTKLCPTRGCGAAIRAQSVLCSECWWRLRWPVKAPLMAAYKQHGPESETYAVLLADAVAYLSELPPLDTTWEPIRG